MEVINIKSDNEFYLEYVGGFKEKKQVTIEDLTAKVNGKNIQIYKDTQLLLEIIDGVVTPESMKHRLSSRTWRIHKYIKNICKLILKQCDKLVIVGYSNNKLYTLVDIDDDSDCKCFITINENGKKIALGDFNFTALREPKKSKFMRWCEVKNQEPVRDFFNQPMEPGMQVFGELTKGNTCFGDIEHIGIDNNNRAYIQVKIIKMAKNKRRKTMKIYPVTYGRNNYVCIDDDEFLLTKMLYMKD